MKASKYLVSAAAALTVVATIGLANAQTNTGNATMNSSTPAVKVQSGTGVKATPGGAKNKMAGSSGMSTNSGTNSAATMNTGTTNNSTGMANSSDGSMKTMGKRSRKSGMRVARTDRN